MPEIAEQTRIAAPLAVVWPLLSDPATVAGCIPGATLAPDQGDGLWRGSVKVRFGPTIAVFKGEAKLDFDHAAQACTIEGAGSMAAAPPAPSPPAPCRRARRARRRCWRWRAASP